MHLATIKGRALCGATQRKTELTATLARVDCAKCQERMERITCECGEAARERRYLAETEAACKKVGIDHLWRAVADNSTDRLMRDVLGTIGRAFAEMGVEVTERKSA